MAYGWISVTLFGIVISWRESQPINAAASMVFSPSFKVTFSSDVSDRNAAYPIVSTDFGIVILFRVLQEAMDFPAMAFVFDGTVVEAFFP